MATSGSKSVAVTSWNTLVFSWTVTGQSSQYNRSTVSWTLKLVSTSSGRIDSSTSKAWSVTIDGKEYSGTTTVGIANNSTKTLASGTETINHASDGTKTFSYSFSQNFTGITFSGQALGLVSGNGSGTLNQIERISTVHIPIEDEIELGSPFTLTISRYVSTFKHKVKWQCKTTETGYIAGSATTYSTALSINWTPPLSMASYALDSNSVFVTVIVETYTADGTFVGKHSGVFYANIPGSVKPSCSVTVTDASGYAQQYGVFLKGFSRLNVVITPTPAYDSPIKSYSTTANGVKYTTANFTTGIVNSAGDLIISASVTDKRNHTGYATKVVHINDYAHPAISKLSVKRCNADGTENGEGEYVKATFSASCDSTVPEASAWYELKYKKSSETEYTTIELVDLDDHFSVTDYSYVFPAEGGSSYDVILTAADGITETSRSTSASTAFTLMHYGADGKSIGFGKLAEKEGVMDIGFVTKFSGGIQNIVLDKYNDLNDVKIPNTYASVNKGATEYENCPIASGTFVLEVMSAGAEGQVFQRLTSTFKETHQTFERHFYQGTWGEWTLVRSDTGWLNLTMESGVLPGSEMGYLKGRLKNGVLYIRGDVSGIGANWKGLAKLPATLTAGVSLPVRFAGVYNISYFASFVITTSNILTIAGISATTWDVTKDFHINTAIHS